jgi:predicted DNA-binding transcriptional regulator YafY
MLKILFELLSKKCVSATYLAEKYEVSKRSIYRYINALEMAGVPLYTIRGNGGGFSIVDTYKLRSTFITKQEFEQTINALQAITDSVPNKNLDSVISKLSATMKNEIADLSIKSGNLIIDAGPWGDTVGYKSKLVTIEKAIEQNLKLEIKYHDRNGTVSERIIEPHVIVFKQGLWYVYGFCYLRNEFRFFKTGRIEYANLSNEHFTRREINKTDLPLNFWHNSIETQEITMEISKKYLSDVEEWLGIENVSENNGKFLATVNLPYDDGLVSKIMSFGNGIKVVSPKELKEKIKNIAKELINEYK